LNQRQLGKGYPIVEAQAIVESRNALVTIDGVP